MFTPEALLDIHERTHRSLAGLMEHCALFQEGELDRQLDGFGYPTIRLQLHHAIAAEQYWVGVLRGLMLVEERDEDRASIEALRSFRARVAETTRAYLSGATTDELDTPRTMTTWGDRERVLAPGHVIVRTQTHAYQHQGQVAAMARLLGRPIPAGLDFPLD